MKKKIKYIVIILALIGMYYAKNQIESNNQSRTKMLDSLEDGTTKVSPK